MHRILAPFSEPAYALLRIAAGFMFACHGAQKELGMFPGPDVHVPTDTLGHVGAWIELIGGLLIMIGLLTSLAAFIASGEMAVAFGMAHWKWGAAPFWPIQNEGELAALYCFVFLYVACRGGGMASVDRALRRRSSASPL